jgi:hypothetical protein
MPNCHQCNQLATTNTRTGDCSICYATGVTFCASCAMWELGPKSTTTDIFPGLKVSSVSRSISVSRHHSEESEESTSSVATYPLDCKTFFPLIAGACKYIESQLDDSVVGPGPFTQRKPADSASDTEKQRYQRALTTHADKPHPAKLYGKSFKEYACGVLKKFHQDLYPTCKYDRVALQVLLIMHLSAQERVQCRFAANHDNEKEGASFRSDVRYLKRWQTRELAVGHLKQHLDAIETKFGAEVKGLVSKKTWQDALGLDDFEYFMKGFKSPTLFAIDLKARAGGVDAARETLELAIILYHALTAARPRDDLDSHWSQSRTNFKPHEALGFVSKAHHEALYDTDTEGERLCQATRDRLNAVWQALGDTSPANTLPTHPRFPDLNVDSSLTTVEKNYLQYLPTFDHPKTQASQRSECEKVVRRRVVDTVAAYREAYLKTTTLEQVYVTVNKVDIAGKMASTKYITLDAPDLDTVSLAFAKVGEAKHCREDIATSEQQKITRLLRAIGDSTYLAQHKPAVTITMTHERGNTRRDNRRDAVVRKLLSACKTDGTNYWLEYSRDTARVRHNGSVAFTWDAEDYTDEIIAMMQSEFYVDQAFDDNLARLTLTATGIVPQGWFPLNLTDPRTRTPNKTKYRDIFPNCSFGSDPEIDKIDTHYEAFGGSSPRPAHYIDWRNHKDWWLYDCFAIDPRRRPLFCSLSLQPLVPEPNPNYGNHTMLFKRSTTRHRSVHTFGDKEQPRRSMLLVLDDIFYEHPKKDGDSNIKLAQNRVKIADDLFRRLENIPGQRSKSLSSQWDTTLQGPFIRYPDPDYLIECQVFGPIVPSRDMLGFITWVEVPRWIREMRLEKFFYVDGSEDTNGLHPGVVAKQQHLTQHYGGTLLPYRPSQHHSRYAPMARPQAQNLDESDRTSLLDKKAADNASTS